MPNTKNSAIRDIVIDRCLSAKKPYGLMEIMKEVNKELIARSEEPVTAPNTIRDQITDIANRWNVAIDEKQQGRVRYYHYSDPAFSIYKAPLRLQDLQKLNQTLELLKDFVGLPHFEWIEEINARIYSSLNTDVHSKPVVGFSYNQEYSYSLRHFSPLFDLILEKAAIELTYQKFTSESPRTYIVYPYYLKEYVNRWYLVASVDQHPDSLSCFAFDRIKSYKPSVMRFRENKIDIEEYFDSMVGLTILEGTKPEEVHLWVEDSQYKYIQTNPIHHTQTCIGSKDGGKLVRLRLYVNTELEMRILSYGDTVCVLQPESLREKIRSRIHNLSLRYEDLVKQPAED